MHVKDEYVTTRTTLLTDILFLDTGRWAKLEYVT